jgi:hypothetical protein
MDMIMSRYREVCDMLTQEVFDGPRSDEES